MNAKDDVVQLNRILTARMPVEELRLHLGHVLQGDVVGGVGEEAGDVEGDVVEVEAHHGAALEIFPDLRVEGDGPGGEVDPADDGADDEDGGAAADVHADVGLGGAGGKDE